MGGINTFIMWRLIDGSALLAVKLQLIVNEAVSVELARYIFQNIPVMGIRKINLFINSDGRIIIVMIN